MDPKELQSKFSRLKIRVKDKIKFFNTKLMSDVGVSFGVVEQLIRPDLEAIDRECKSLDEQIACIDLHLKKKFLKQSATLHRQILMLNTQLNEVVAIDYRIQKLFDFLTSFSPSKCKAALHLSAEWELKTMKALPKLTRLQLDRIAITELYLREAS